MALFPLSAEARSSSWEMVAGWKSGGSAPLSSGIVEAVGANCSWKSEVVIMHRAKWLKKWTSRALELAAEEKKLHSRLPCHRKKILEGKKLLVLKEMLADEMYPDQRLVDDIESGFDLVGTCGESGQRYWKGDLSSLPQK